MINFDQKISIKIFATFNIAGFKSTPVGLHAQRFLLSLCSGFTFELRFRNLNRTLLDIRLLKKLQVRIM